MLLELIEMFKMYEYLTHLISAVAWHNTDNWRVSGKVEVLTQVQVVLQWAS